MSNPELHVQGDSTATMATPVVDRGPAKALAVIVSQVGSPPVLAIVAASVAAAVAGGGAAYSWVALHVALMVLLPLGFLFLLMRRGQVSDVDVYRREERWRPFLVTVVGAWAGWGLLAAGSAPAGLVGVAGVLALEATVIFLVTLGWKISLHCATLAVTGAVVWKLTGSPVALLVGIPLMIWSRLLLKRHTPAQTIAGTLLGILLVVLFFDLFAGTV